MKHEVEKVFRVGDVIFESTVEAVRHCQVLCKAEDLKEIAAEFYIAHGDGEMEICDSDALFIFMAESMVPQIRGTV